MRLRGDPLPTQQYVAEKHWQITAHDILGKTKVERLNILWQATFPGQNSTYAAIFWCMQRTTRSAVISQCSSCSVRPLTDLLNLPTGSWVTMLKKWFEHDWHVIFLSTSEAGIYLVSSCQCHRHQAVWKIGVRCTSRCRPWSWFWRTTGWSRLRWSGTGSLPAKPHKS